LFLTVCLPASSEDRQLAGKGAAVGRCGMNGTRTGCNRSSEDPDAQKGMRDD
jgi:hypothetical protein